MSLLLSNLIALPSQFTNHCLLSHPLATKDILSLSSQPTKITEFFARDEEGLATGVGHFSIVFPVLRLSRSARHSLSKAKRLIKKRGTLRQLTRLKNSGILKPDTSWLSSYIKGNQQDIEALKKANPDGSASNADELKLDVESSRVCLLLSGPPEYDTLMSFSTPFKGRKQAREDMEVDSDSESDGENDADGKADDDDDDLLGTFWRQERIVKKDFSFIRTGDANWLLCSMLTSVVEDVMPIIFAYRLQLEIMQDRFNDGNDRSGEAFLVKVHEIQREIEWIQRKVKVRRQNTNTQKHMSYIVRGWEVESTHFLISLVLEVHICCPFLSSR